MNGTILARSAPPATLKPQGSTVSRPKRSPLPSAMGKAISPTKIDIAQLDSRLDMLQWVIGIQSAVTLATFAIVAARLL